MKQFLSPYTRWGQVSGLALLAMLGLMAQMDCPTAEAKPKKPKDVPGLELPIFATMSAIGYAGYTYLKFRKRP